MRRTVLLVGRALGEQLKGFARTGKKCPYPPLTEEEANPYPTLQEMFTDEELLDMHAPHPRHWLSLAELVAKHGPPIQWKNGRDLPKYRHLSLPNPPS